MVKGYVSQICRSKRYPKAVLFYLMRKGILLNMLNVSESTIKDVSMEIDDILKLFKDRLPDFRPTSGLLNRMDLYLITRVTKPECVLETGVERGWASAIILAALEKNRKGTLFSIDLPLPMGILEEKMVGEVVPSELRHRWKLYLGRSDDLMLDILKKEIKKLDIFIHDSCHSYETMMWEYLTAWRFIKDNGFILSHDTVASDAFFDIARQLKCPYTWTPHGEYGVIKKVKI